MYCVLRLESVFCFTNNTILINFTCNGFYFNKMSHWFLFAKQRFFFLCDNVYFPPFLPVISFQHLKSTLFQKPAPQIFAQFAKKNMVVHPVRNSPAMK